MTTKLKGGPHAAESLKLPARYMELPNPPQLGTVEIHLDGEEANTHPIFLWSAKIGKQTFHVYRPERRGRKSGFRIDFNNKSRMTFPSQSHFEDALFHATDKALDEYYKSK